MGRIEILEEREEVSGWAFEVRVDGAPHTLHLSWADYNLWSADGRDAPGSVATAVLRFLAEKTDGGLPATLDAATSRRRYQDADVEIPRLITKRG